MSDHQATMSLLSIWWAIHVVNAWFVVYYLFFFYGKYNGRYRGISLHDFFWDSDFKVFDSTAMITKMLLVIDAVLMIGYIFYKTIFS